MHPHQPINPQSEMQGSANFISIPRIQNLPYDIRLVLWQATFQDETRVIPAKSSFEKGTGILTIPITNRHDPGKWLDVFRHDYVASILPSLEEYVRLAEVFFAPEICSCDGFLRSLLGTRSGKTAVGNSKNIHFILDMRPFVNSLLEEVSTIFETAGGAPGSFNKASTISGRIDTLNVSFSPPNEIESIAIPAWNEKLYFKMNSDQCTATDYFIKAMYSLPSLKTIYVVAYDGEDLGVIPFGSPRFTNLTLSKEELTGITTNKGEEKLKLNAIDVQRYQNTSRFRSHIRTKWRLFRQGKNIKRPCPEIEMVSWVRSEQQMLRISKKE